MFFPLTQMISSFKSNTDFANDGKLFCNNKYEQKEGPVQVGKRI